MAKTRSESTRELTVTAFSWLFMRQKCRVLADEVGLNGLASRLAPSAGAIWRADAVGICRVGKQFRIDVVEVKGSRADARREDMTRGKWEMLPIGKRLNGWLLVSADCRPEDYKGLPAAWGVLQASADGSTLKTIRRPKAEGLVPHGNILLDAADAAPDLYAASYRTLTSRIPFLGRAIPEAVAKLHAEAEKQEDVSEFLGFERPDPLPQHIPGGPGDTRVLELDAARTYPFSFTVDLPTDPTGPVGGVVCVRGLDGSVVGYGSLTHIGGSTYSVDASIDYSSAERLLIETSQARPGKAVRENGVSIEWAPDGGQS